MVKPIPSLPAALDQFAILLDVDGTILDLAPTPREVFVSHTLRDTLARLWERTDGAMAFVSGRPVSELDLIFSPLQLPAIGGHGAELRTIAGGALGAPRLPPLDPALKRRFAAIAEAGPGIVLEDKGITVQKLRQYFAGQGLLACAALPAGAAQGERRARLCCQDLL